MHLLVCEGLRGLRLRFSELEGKIPGPNGVLCARVGRSDSGLTGVIEDDDDDNGFGSIDRELLISSTRLA